jgi:RNA polymerase sigma-70 factor (ECF subfamily)
MLRTLPTVAEDIDSDDEAFLRRSIDGNGEAFGVLFDRHHDRVFRHAMRLLESRQDADDAVAAAYLELWRRRREVRIVNGSVLPWLLATVTNVSRNLKRSLRRHHAFLARLSREPDYPDPADVLVDSTLLGVDVKLREALKALPKHELVLFSMVVLEGYSVPDAAAALGIGIPAAKSRLLRARRRIRQDLTGGFGLPTEFQSRLEVEP